MKLRYDWPTALTSIHTNLTAAIFNYATYPDTGQYLY